MKKIETTSKTQANAFVRSNCNNDIVANELWKLIENITSTQKTFSISLYFCASSDLVEFDKNNQNLFNHMKKRQASPGISDVIKINQSFKFCNYKYTIAYNENKDIAQRFILINAWC